MGPKNVVQVIIDNAFNGRSIGDLVMKDYPSIVWTPYVTQLYIWIFSLRTSQSCHG